MLRYTKQFSIQLSKSVVHVDACRIIFESNAYVTKFFVGLSQKCNQQSTLDKGLIRNIIANTYHGIEVLCDLKVILANLIISDSKMIARIASFHKQKRFNE